MKHSDNYKYHLAALFAVTVWGATFVSTKVLIAHGLTPATIFFDPIIYLNAPNGNKSI